MSFDEERFRRLVDETESKIVALGTTSPTVLNKHMQFADQLTEFLRKKDCDFDMQLCLDFANTLEHDISLVQQKTGAPLQVPIDAETENAIIDYVLHERRECDTNHIFVTGVGPVQGLKRRHYRIRYRAKGTPSEDTIPHDGLHIFRRTFASRLLNSGAALPVISEMMGHTDRNSVQCYLSTDEEKMKRCSLSLSMIPYEGGVYHV